MALSDLVINSKAFTCPWGHAVGNISSLSTKKHFSIVLWKLRMARRTPWINSRNDEFTWQIYGGVEGSGAVRSAFWGLFQYKDRLSSYRNSHCKDTTVLCYYDKTFTGITVSLCWSRFRNIWVTPLYHIKYALHLVLRCFHFGTWSVVSRFMACLPIFFKLFSLGQ